MKAQFVPCRIPQNLGIEDLKYFDSSGQGVERISHELKAASKIGGRGANTAFFLDKGNPPRT